VVATAPQERVTAFSSPGSSFRLRILARRQRLAFSRRERDDNSETDCSGKAIECPERWALPAGLVAGDRLCCDPRSLGEELLRQAVPEAEFSYDAHTRQLPRYVTEYKTPVFRRSGSNGQRWMSAAPGRILTKRLGMMATAALPGPEFDQR
jgi:hypothetical protein